MIKYVSIAALLKCFSSTQFTRSVYRRLGNYVGNRRRGTGGMPNYYLDRLKWILRLQNQLGIIKKGDRILELGTGWLHWEALTLRLFYDIEAVLFDVWDNRQLGGLQNYMRQLAPVLGNGFNLTQLQIERARSLINQILAARSFDSLYELLGFSYVVESSGDMSEFSVNEFDLVVSGGVLEHVKRTAIPGLVEQMHRVLKPGGWAVHSIDTADHLEHYDRSVSPKFYLCLSEVAWKGLCENEVQYINRVQRGEWLELFDRHGFDVVDEECRRVDINELKIAKRFAHMARSDLECTVLRFAFRRRT
jgi:SAM-dependent methyltransferase